ncbi:MAG: hypothetical protein SPJ71_04270 [Candidatus Limisoma sp.]|nr:hypothetical protein [Bacteroidales bacterium]MDD7759248.1 hypothetical protein [Bacteroidales bacterium]MDY5893771.1 hypothetical protein [Candidatus Limisoma sp.]
MHTTSMSTTVLSTIRRGSTITATAGAIRIGGAQGAVAEVYTPGGALLYRGTESTIAMPRGLYIVKVAGRTAKVVI